MGKNKGVNDRINRRISAETQTKKRSQFKRLRWEGGGELLFVLRSYRGGFRLNQNFEGFKVPVAGREVEGNFFPAA